MTQLDLFKWTQKESLLIDLGGRCSYCLESENWLVVNKTEDENYVQYDLECQTTTSFDDGEFAGLCKHTHELVEVIE